MSSSSNSRGRGYPRRSCGRGYSARPSPPPPHPDTGAGFVSGDSHLSAVRAANDCLRRGGGRGPPPPYRQGPYQQRQYDYGGGYGYGYGQPQQPGPLYGAVPYNYGQPQQPGPFYGAVPYNYGNPQQQQPPPMPPGPQYGYGAPNPYAHGRPHSHPQQYGRAPGDAGFRPGAPQLTPRLADYRRLWRSAKQRPPQQAERFRVLSYNILADYLAQEHRFLYEGIPFFMLDWIWRKEKLAFEFHLWSPDILCLQEVDKFTDLEQELARRGYSGIWKMRTGNAADGCAVFWRTTRFQLRYEEDIEFNKIGLRDNVAQICVLESLVPRNVPTDSTSSPSHPQQAKQIVVCNIHVLYNPKRGDIKLGQVRTLLNRAYAVSKMWNDAPVILCGDFNSTPKSPLYNFVLEKKLNLSGLAKNIISGQLTSASPQRLYAGPNTSRKPQTKTTKLVQNSCPAGRGSVLPDAPSESCINTGSSISCGNTIACSRSSSTNLDKQELSGCLEGPSKDSYTSDAAALANKTEGEGGTAIDKSSEGCTGRIKTEPGEEPNITGVSSAPVTVCGEILQSGSSEIVDSTQLLSSDESFGLKHSLEEIGGGSKKVSNTHRDLPSAVILEGFTCVSEENGARSGDLLAVSKDNPDENEKAIKSMMSGQGNRTTNEPESSDCSGTQGFADALHQMSNVRLERKSSTEATHVKSPAERVLQSNGAGSDACGNQSTSEVMNNHSVSYRDESENNAGAFEDETTANEVSCTGVNSDPTFFEELTGVNDCLLVEEDQLPEISDGSPSSQQMVTSNGSYDFYDPYKWTPDEIIAATGKDECTYVEHNLKVRSVYTDVEDFEGTKDANKEPLVTSYNRKFMGTVDYIWASEDLQTVQVLDTFPKEILKQTIGFPTKKWGSDHIALVCELAFTK